MSKSKIVKVNGMSFNANTLSKNGLKWFIDTYKDSTAFGHLKEPYKSDRLEELYNKVIKSYNLKDETKKQIKKSKNEPKLDEDN